MAQNRFGHYRGFSFNHIHGHSVATFYRDRRSGGCSGCLPDDPAELADVQRMVFLEKRWIVTGSLA